MGDEHTSDRAKAAAHDAKGKVKEAAGTAQGDEELRAEGKKDQTKGDVKQAGEKIKDAFKS